MNVFAQLCILLFQINSSRSQNHITCATAEGEKVKEKTKLEEIVQLQEIVGDASRATYAPFQVLVTSAKKGATEGFEICGGTIISERFVITASHCIAEGKEPLNLTTHNVFVVFGQLDVCPARKEVIRKPKGPWKDVILAKKLFVHPDYHKMLAWENDIAIIEVYIASHICVP